MIKLSSAMKGGLTAICSRELWTINLSNVFNQSKVSNQSKVFNQLKVK